MQTLGLSGSTARTGSRAKVLFWPAIRNDADLDYISLQGFWVCTLVAALGLVVSVVFRTGMFRVLGIVDAIFYYLAGNGVRMGSRAAALLAFAAYLLSSVLLQKRIGAGFGIVRLVFLALLLATVRGIWLSASWKRNESEPPLLRLHDTWRDKIADQFPQWLWPKARPVFFVLAAVEILLLARALFPIVRAGPKVG